MDDIEDQLRKKVGSWYKNSFAPTSILPLSISHKQLLFCYISLMKTGGQAPGGTPLCDLNGDVRPDRVWFSGCFVLNGVSISLLSVLNRVLLHYLKA